MRLVPYDRERHHRRSIRLTGFDYSAPGSYHITICTHARECLFGEITNGLMQANAHGEVALTCWHSIPSHFPNVRLDAFVVMPNHIHGIIVIDGIVAETRDVEATHASPLPNVPRGPQQASIGAIVGSYKSAVTRRVNAMRGTPGWPVWQRNYYEHVIRDEDEFYRIVAYIEENPRRWADDEYHA
jgi:REP element-mobilizing transposase RayT